MTSEERRLFARLDAWLAEQKGDITIFDVVKTDDVELFGAFVLRQFRLAAKDAVTGRLEREAGKLSGRPSYGAAALVSLIDWLQATWEVSADDMCTLAGISDADLNELRGGQLPADTQPLIERLAMLLDVQQALNGLLPTQETINHWLRSMSPGRLKEDKSALDLMLAGGREAIKYVRAYLWSQLF